MNIKTKLTLGVGLLFILIIILSLTGAFNIQALKSDSENILTANYKSLQYCTCLLYTSDAADERSSVDLGGRRIIKKKTIKQT